MIGREEGSTVREDIVVFDWVAAGYSYTTSAHGMNLSCFVKSNALSLNL